MRFGRLAAWAITALILPPPAPAAAAPGCLLNILCAPPPALPSTPPAPVPPPESITQPVTDKAGPVVEDLKTSLATLESRMLTLINAERAGAGLPALQISDWAQGVAREFSHTMMAAGSIWHNQSYFARGRQAMKADLLSENVGYDSSIPANHTGFMASPVHRANIMDRRFTHVGIGVAVGSDGRIYVTEDFARIPGSAAPSPKTKPGNQPGSPVRAVSTKAGEGAPVSVQAGEPVTLELAAEGRPESAGFGQRPEDSSPAGARVKASEKDGSPLSMLPTLAATVVFSLIALSFLLGARCFCDQPPSRTNSPASQR